MKDEELVDLYIVRDESAIKKTEEKYGKYCYTIAYRILYNNEDSEECVNDTFFGAWNSIPPNRPKMLSTYLGKITRRTALNIWRRKDTLKRGQGVIEVSLNELEDCVADTDFIDKFEKGSDLTSIINYFLNGLSEEARIVFLRRYYYMDSIEQISKELLISKSKVTSMLFRLRKSLRDLLVEEDIYE